MLTESAEQRRLAKWLDVAVGAYGWMHCPNEGRRKHGKQATMLGLKKGFPDLIVFPAPHAPVVFNGRILSNVRGVALELKRADGGTGLSPEQARWFRELQRNGWHVILAAGAEHAVLQLQAVGIGEGVPLPPAAERRG